MRTYIVGGHQLLGPTEPRDVHPKRRPQLKQAMAALHRADQELRARIAEGQLVDELVQRVDRAQRRMFVLLFGPYNPWLADMDRETHTAAVDDWERGGREGPRPHLVEGTFFDGLTDAVRSELAGSAGAANA